MLKVDFRPGPRSARRPACAASSGQLQLRLGVADDPVVSLGGDRIGDQAAVSGLLDGRRDDDLLLREPHAAELDREPLQGSGVAAGGFGVGARNLRHRVQAVEDHSGQPDRFRELGIRVDRIRVARRLRIALGQAGVGGDPQLRQRVALLEVAHRCAPIKLRGRCRSRCREPSPRPPGWWIRTRTRRSLCRPARRSPCRSRWW